jgi:hypothetical protein
MDHKMVYLILEDIDKILDSLFMCGLCNASKNISSDCITTAVECKKYGLDFADEKLRCIAEAIEESRHNSKYNFEKAINELCTLGCYLNVIKSKIQLDTISSKL